MRVRGKLWLVLSEEQPLANGNWKCRRCLDEAPPPRSGGMGPRTLNFPDDRLGRSHTPLGVRASLPAPHPSLTSGAFCLPPRAFPAAEAPLLSVQTLCSGHVRGTHLSLKADTLPAGSHPPRPDG